MKALVCTKISRPVGLAFLIFFFLVTNARGANFYSVSGGAWETPSNWVTDACGGAATASGIPQSGDNVFICSAVILNSTVTVNNLTINSGGNLSFAASTASDLTVNGNLTVNSGGTFQAVAGTIAHILKLAGSFTNNGSVDFWKSTTSNVSLNFNGSTNTVISGSGIWNLFAVTMNKDMRDWILEVQASAFFTNFNSGSWTLTQGTYFHNCNKNFVLASGNYTINANTIVRVGNGTLNIASSGSELILEGGLEITGGIVNVGNTNGGSPNSLRYRQSGANIPFINISGTGLLNSFQGINTIVSGANTPFRFVMTGGAVTLNTGTIRSTWESFRVADVNGSVFTMSGGTITIGRHNSGTNISDFAVCGGSGIVTSTGVGIVQFGTVGSPSETYTFTAFPNVTLPNFKVGEPNRNVTLRPLDVGNFNLLSLYIETGNFFDMTGILNSSVTDARTMTLSRTDGTAAFFDNNNETTNHFIFRESTVAVTGNATIRTNTAADTSLRRFYNLNIASTGRTINLINTFGVSNLLTVSGGEINSSSRSIYLYGVNPLSVINGSVITLSHLIFNGAQAQNLPGYNYNCSIMAQATNTQIKQQGNVTCRNLKINGNGISLNSVSYIISNSDSLHVREDFDIGCSGCTASSNADFNSAKIKIDGNFNLNTNSLVNAMTSTINVAKDWNNTSAPPATGFNEGQSSVIFIGTGKNQIRCTNCDATDGEIFYNLGINKTGKDTLLSPVTVSKNLSFIKGYFFSTYTNKVIIQSAATVSGASDASFVDGPVQKENAGKFDFPIGDSAKYKPLGITPTNLGSSTFTAEYIKGPAPYSYTTSKASGVLDVSKCEYWNLKRDAGSSSTTVKLSYNSSSCVPTEYTTYKVTNWNSSQWIDLGRGGSGTSGNATAGFVESSAAVSSFGIFTLQSCQKPTVSKSGAATFCLGKSVTLTSEYPTNNVWSPGGQTTSSITVTASGSYTVTTTTSSGCTATSVPIDVIVNSLPAQPTTTTVSPGTICDSAIVTMTASGPSGISDYRWYDDNITTTSFAGGPSYTTPTKIKANRQFYVASRDGNGCESTQRTAVNVNITSSPPVPTSADAFICDPGEIILTAGGSAGGYIWYDVDQAGTPVYYGSNFVIPNLTATKSYYVAASASGCESGRFKVTASLHTRPSSPIGIPDSICGGGSVTLKATGSSSGYKWYKTSGTTTVEATTASYTTPNLTTTTSFFVSAMSPQGCESGSRVPVLAKVKKIPALPVAINGSRCGPGEVNLAVSGVTGSYKWFKNTSDLIVLSSTSVYNPNLSKDSTFYVYSDSLGCFSNRIPVVATVLPQPALPTGSDVPRCGPGKVTLEASASATSFKWYLDSTGTSVQGTSPTYNTDSISTDTKYYVSSVSADGCESNGRTKINAIIKQLPILPSVVDGANCGPGKVKLEASASASSFKWYLDSTSTIVQAILPTYITDSILTNTKYYVSSVSSDGCESSGRAKATAIIKAIPAPPSPVDNSRCGPGDVILSATGSNDKYKWYVSDSGGIPLDSLESYTAKSLSADQTFYVSSQEDGCQSDRVEVEATIHPIPSKPVAVGDSSCGIGDLDLLASGASDYYWYSDASSTIKLDSGAAFTAKDISTTQYFFVSAISDKGCESSDRTPVQALILDNPGEPTAKDTSLCGAGAVKLTASASSGTFKWYNTKNFQIGSQPDYQTGTIDSDSIFYVSSIVSGCESIKKPVFVKINPLPSSPTVKDTSICGAQSVKLSASGSPDTYNWYLKEDDDSSKAVKRGEEFSSVISSTISYYVSSISSQNCESEDRATVTVTFTKKPEAPVSVPKSRCGSGDIDLSVTGLSQNFLWYTTKDSLLGGSATYRAYVESDSIFYAVSDSAGCLSTKTTVQALIKPLPPAPTVRDTAICRVGSMTLSASGSPESYRWYDSLGVLLVENQFITINNISKTTTVYVKSSLNGCENEIKTPLTVRLDSIPPAPKAEVIPVCGGGKVALSASGSVGNYFWFDTETSTSELKNSPDYLTDSLSVSRLFYVLAEKNNCKSERVAVNALVYPLPVEPLTVGDTICDYETTLTLKASGNFENFIWYATLAGNDSLDSGNSLTVNLSSTSTYYVSSLDKNGCKSPRTPVLALVNPSPEKPDAKGIQRCGPGPAILIASGYDEYKWYESGALLANQNDTLEVNSVTEDKSYFVTSVMQGCESQEKTKVDVTINPLPPKPEGIENSVCEKGSVLLSAKNSQDKYYWYTGNSDTEIPVDTTLADYQTPFLTDTTKFYVSAVDLFGCISEKTEVTAYVKPLPKAPVTYPDSTCDISGEINLRAEGVADVFKWYTAEDSEIPVHTGTTFDTTNLQVTTNYYVESVVKGCSSSVRTIVTAKVKSRPDSPVTVNDTICGGGDMELKAITPGADSYIWYSKNSVLTGKNKDTLHVKIQESTLFSVASVLGGCESSGQTDVWAIVKPYPILPEAKGGFSCGPGRVTLNASGTGKLLWYKSSLGGQSIGQGGTIVTLSTLENDTSYYVTSEAQGCENSSRVQVIAKIKPKPAIPVTEDQKICGSKLVTLIASGAPADGEYLWFVPDSSEVKYSGAAYEFNAVATTTMNVAVGLDGCKSDRVSVTVRVDTIPTIPTTADVSRCGSGDVKLLASGSSGQFNWYDKTDLQKVFGTGKELDLGNQTANSSYLVSAFDENCESEKVEVNVTINPESRAGSLQSPATLVCNGANSGTITAVGVEGAVKSWLVSGNNFLTVSAESPGVKELEYNNISTPTGYKIIVQNGNCPADTSEAFILSVDSSPMTVSGTLLLEDSTTSGGVLKLDGYTGNIIRWESSSDGITYAPIVSTDSLYKFSIRSIDNFYRAIVKSGTCPERTSEAYYLGEFLKMKIYTSFSPNGDGVNDTWFIDGIEAFPDNKVSIFNRWGNLVYEASGYDNSIKVWKGTTNTGMLIGNDNTLPDGTYFYSLDWGKGKKASTGYVVIKR